MRTIVVKLTLQAPIERLFDQISNHAGYTALPGVRKATLVKNGRPNKNGVGAVREVDAGLLWVREEITAYQRPRRLDYQIVSSRPRLEHRGGSIRLKKTASGTEVTWTSTFRVAAPLLGRLLTPLFAAQLARGFKAGLQEFGRRAAAS